MIINVNAKEIVCLGNKTMEYDDVVYHAHGDNANPTAKYTVVWRIKNSREGGTLHAGQEVELRENMYFSVVDTSNA